MKKIAIIGTGLSGLTLGRDLNSIAEVTFFENLVKNAKMTNFRNFKKCISD